MLWVLNLSLKKINVRTYQQTLMAELSLLDLLNRALKSNPRFILKDKGNVTVWQYLESKTSVLPLFNKNLKPISTAVYCWQPLLHFCSKNCFLDIGLLQIHCVHTGSFYCPVISNLKIGTSHQFLFSFIIEQQVFDVAHFSQNHFLQNKLYYDSIVDLVFRVSIKWHIFSL